MRVTACDQNAPARPLAALTAAAVAGASVPEAADRQASSAALDSEAVKALSMADADADAGGAAAEPEPAPA
jgi:hypothetical protein